MSATPVLDRFIFDVTEVVKARDAKKLLDYLHIEPPFPDVYRDLIEELRRHYPSSSQRGETGLLGRCENVLSRHNNKWTAFPTFLKLYLSFIRDLNPDNLLETYNALRVLVK